MKTVKIQFEYENYGFKIISTAVNGVLEDVTILDIRECKSQDANRLHLINKLPKPVYRSDQRHFNDKLSVLDTLKNLKDVIDITIQEIKNAEVI